MIAVMGPEAAVNAVYFNKIQEKPEAERAAYVQKLRDEYRPDVDIYKLASELVIDDDRPGRRAAATSCSAASSVYARRFQPRSEKKHGVFPV